MTNRNKLIELMQDAPKNSNFQLAFYKVKEVLETHTKMSVSLSGGSDSDTVLDLIEMVKPYCEKLPEIRYIFFNTGLEYRATLKHLTYLEQKYNITIERLTPKKTLPVAVREYGQPFLSKDVSEKIDRLQRKGFNFTMLLEEVTEEEFPKMQGAKKWFFNLNTNPKGGKSAWNINKNKLLQEFLIEYPPQFKISEKCCTYVKKDVAKIHYKEFAPDVSVLGMRKAEHGKRALLQRACYEPKRQNKEMATYYPLWRWSDEDKQQYKQWRGLRYSDAYEVYGLTRTGCVGCPFNSKAEQELEQVRPYEPALVNAAKNIFGLSYEYKRQYQIFKE